MKTLKFRCWDIFTKKMYNWDTMNAFDTAPGSIKRYFTDSDCRFMQYTGVNDKHGKEIYEGDIVEYYDSMRMYLMAEVKWLDGQYVIQHDGMDSDYIELQDFMLPGGSIEVKGNIYETPNLLNK